MDRFHFINNFETTLAEPAEPGDTAILVADDTGIGEIPSGKKLALTIVSPVNDRNVEIVYCINNPASNVLIVQRGREGTNPGGTNFDTWPAGTKIGARITAHMLDSAPTGFDNDVVEVGYQAINLQVYRSDPSNRAEGDSSIVMGNARAAGFGSIAIGDSAEADGQGSQAVALGASSKALGAVSVAVGYQAHAGGDSPTTAVGNAAQALGSVSTAVGNGALADLNAHASLAMGDSSKTGSPAEVALLSGSGIIAGRVASYGVYIGTGKNRPFEAGRHVGGLEFVDQSHFNAGAPWGPLDWKTAGEVTLYSPPIQIGDQGWQPETEYVRGQAIAPGNGYSYVAMIPFGDGTEHTATSGSVEPSWSTTPGSATIDGDVTWYCHTLDATWLVPDYARFVPLRALVIATHVSRGMSPVEAEVSVGVDGEMDKWLGATFLSASRLSGPGGTEILELENSEWAQEFGFELTAPAVDVDMTVIFALQGIVVESPNP